MTNALIFFDESGDLGFKFNKPYREGGSSRFFTIAAAIGKNGSHRKFGSAVRSLRKKQGWTSKNEKKWANIGTSPKSVFSNIALSLVEKEPNIKILVSCLEKEKLPEHIAHANHHLIYAWMVSSLICPYITDIDSVSLAPDNLNQGLGNSIFEDMIKKVSWFDLGSKNDIRKIIHQSIFNDGITFCDFIAGATREHYEENKSDPFNIIKDKIIVHDPLSGMKI